jgi:RNA polymerase sigma-70 factor (ECF subfamily)
VDVDRSLVERAQHGDREAFTALAAGVSDRAYALALRVLRDPDAAGDALQTALVKMWRDLPSLRDPDRFDAWMYRVVLRCCQVDRRRNRRTVAALELLPNDAAVGDTQASVADRDEIERAFRKLTHDQRAVLVLLYYQDLSVHEVAEIVGVSPGTIKSRLHYARQAMRAAVEAGSRAPASEGRTA